MVRVVSIRRGDQDGGPIMKKLGMLGIIGGAAILTAAPLSPQWSQKTVMLSLDSAQAQTGGPPTATSVAGVSRRAHRRSYRRAGYGTASGYGTAYGYNPYTDCGYVPYGFSWSAPCGYYTRCSRSTCAIRHESLTATSILSVAAESRGNNRTAGHFASPELFGFVLWRI